MNATLGKLSLSTSNGQATCPRPWAEVLRWAAQPGIAVLNAQPGMANNVFLNGPRAGINLHHSLGGGDKIAGNIVFSTAAGAATMGPSTAGTGSAAPALSCANSCGLGVGAIVKAKLGLQPNRSTRRILGRSATKPASWLTPSSGRS